MDSNKIQCSKDKIAIGDAIDKMTKRMFQLQGEINHLKQAFKFIEESGSTLDDSYFLMDAKELVEREANNG